MKSWDAMHYWNIYIYSNVTRATITSPDAWNCYFWKLKYGKYNLTYIGNKILPSFTEGSGGAFAEFG